MIISNRWFDKNKCKLNTMEIWVECKWKILYEKEASLKSENAANYHHPPFNFNPPFNPPLPPALPSGGFEDPLSKNGEGGCTLW